MRENVWTKISAIAGVVAVIFAVCFFWQGRIDQSKKLESNPLTPPNFTPDHSPMLAVAAIHATLLAIFLGVLSTYGFYRRTVSDQLETKLYQEAKEINTIPFARLYEYIPEPALAEAKQLIKSTSLIQRVERLQDIIRQGETIAQNLPTLVGREAFHLILALVLHSPFPEALESRRDPTPVPFPDIATTRFWVAKMGQVTIPLIRAHESTRNGLQKVLDTYSIQEGMHQYSFSSLPFFKNLDAAHEIRHRVNERLQEIDRHQKSAIGKGWLIVGFLGASVTFVIGVLMPVHNLPISRNLIQGRVHLWEPTAFYILALASIAYLIFIA